MDPTYVCPLACQNVSSETTGSIELKFYMETPKGEGTNVCANSSGCKTKMVTMSIFGLKLFKIFLGTKRPIIFGIGTLCSTGDVGPMKCLQTMIIVRP